MRYINEKEFQALLQAAILTIDGDEYYDLEISIEHNVAAEITAIHLTLARYLTDNDIYQDCDGDYRMKEQDIADNACGDIESVLDDCGIIVDIKSAECHNASFNHVVEKRTWDYPGADYFEVEGTVVVKCDIKIDNENVCKDIANYLQSYYNKQ